MKTKKCSKCNIIQSVDNFYFQNKVKNERHSQCKTCSEQSRKNKEHYLKYREKYIERNNIRKGRVKNFNMIALNEYLKTHPCVVCGENDPLVLEFDHLDNQKYNVSKMRQSYNWETILKEISKCQVLCANCHKRKTAKQFNWGKLKLQ